MFKEALSVERKILFKEKQLEGFLEASECNYITTILSNYKYLERTYEMEHDANVKQIIPYIVIVNRKAEKVFAYRRASDERYSEARLRSKWSIGVGGHIEKQDDGNPIEKGMMREFHEEVIMKNYPKPELIGYINLEKEVEKYHFALVYLTDTSEDVKVGDGEIDICGFYSISEFEDILKKGENVLEEWSKISWPVIKRLLLSK